MNGGTFESQLNWAWVRILSEKIIVQVFPRDADYEAQHSVPGTTKTHRNCKSQKKEKKKKLKTLLSIYTFMYYAEFMVNDWLNTL